MLKFGLPISLRMIIKKFKITPGIFLKKMFKDKKVENNQLTLILCSKIGTSFIKKGIDKKFLLDFLKEEFY